MKNVIVLCLFSAVACGMQKDKNPEFTRHVVSLENPQPVPSATQCGTACVCITCINNASDQLQIIKSKLPFLTFIRKNKQLEGGRAIAAAQMIHRACELVQEIKRFKLKVKMPKNMPAARAKESKMAIKEPEPVRLPTPENSDDDFAELTNPSQRKFSWLLQQAEGGI